MTPSTDTRVSALLQLAERCEKAVGLDRELNLCIHEALGNCVHRETEYYAVQSDTGFTCKACRKDTYGFRVPNYSASLDAAMQLVPEGVCWRVIAWPKNTRGFKAGALIEGSPDAGGATPALALCAAALRARAAS